MDSSIKLNRCLDFGVIGAILKDPSIWDSISEDGSIGFSPDMIGEYWITIVANDKLIGCFRFHQHTSVCWESHAHILKQYRKKYSKIAGIEGLKWVVDNIPNLKTLYSKVPSKYTNVVKYLNYLGFSNCGKLRNSFTKNGKLFDLLYMSIAIEDMPGGD